MNRFLSISLQLLTAYTSRCAQSVLQYGNSRIWNVAAVAQLIQYCKTGSQSRRKEVPGELQGSKQPRMLPVGGYNLLVRAFNASSSLLDPADQFCSVAAAPCEEVFKPPFRTRPLFVERVELGVGLL